MAKLALNLGCGSIHKRSDSEFTWINVDIAPPADEICRVGVDKLPAKDSSVDRVEADNLMEHLDNDEFMQAMNEVHRVLRPGGVFWWKVPNAEDFPGHAWGDPTHKRYFFERSFIYLDHASPTHTNYGKAYGFKSWEFRKLEKERVFWVAEMSPVK